MFIKLSIILNIYYFLLWYYGINLLLFIYFNTFHLLRIVLLFLPPLRDVVLRGGVVAFISLL